MQTRSFAHVRCGGSSNRSARWALWIESKTGRAPLQLAAHEGLLRGIDYENRFGSAQVKSALLLAGLGAGGAVLVREPRVSRRHTEKMLAAMGAPIELTQHSVLLRGPFDELRPFDFELPADPSSAAPWLALSVARQGSACTLEDLLLPPERAGFVRVLREMGASIDEHPRREVFAERVCDLHSRGSKLHGVQIGADEVPSLIDELPLLGLLMCVAEGPSELRGAAELRTKESDRIAKTVATLRAFGAELEELEDGWRCPGGSLLKGADVSSAGDHRVAMLATVAALLAEGTSTVRDAGCIADSYASFLSELQSLGQEVRALNPDS